MAHAAEKSSAVAPRPHAAKTLRNRLSMRSVGSAHAHMTHATVARVSRVSMKVPKPVGRALGREIDGGRPSSVGQLATCNTTMQTVPPNSSTTVIAFIPTAPNRPKQRSTRSSYVSTVAASLASLSVLKHQTRLLAV